MIIIKKASKALLVYTSSSLPDIMIEAVRTTSPGCTIIHGEVYSNDRYRGYYQEIATMDMIVQFLDASHIKYDEVTLLFDSVKKGLDDEPSREAAAFLGNILNSTTYTSSVDTWIPMSVPRDEDEHN